MYSNSFGELNMREIYALILEQIERHTSRKYSWIRIMTAFAQNKISDFIINSNII